MSDNVLIFNDLANMFIKQNNNNLCNFTDHNEVFNINIFNIYNKKDLIKLDYLLEMPLKRIQFNIISCLLNWNEKTSVIFYRYHK